MGLGLDKKDKVFVDCKTYSYCKFNLYRFYLDSDLFSLKHLLSLEKISTLVEIDEKGVHLKGNV